MNINTHPALTTYLVTVYATHRDTGARHMLIDTVRAESEHAARIEMIDRTVKVGYRDIVIHACDEDGVEIAA